MNKLMIALICFVSASVHAAGTSYSCKALAEKEVGTPIFSDLTLTITNKKVDITGKFISIGSTKSEKIKTTAIRKKIKPNDTSAKYAISNPFDITVYLPLNIIDKSPENIKASFGYSDGSNGYVIATGNCTLNP